MMQYIRSSLAVIALVLITIFAIQNIKSVEVDFLIWSASVSKIVVILGSYVMGMLTGWGMIDLFKRFLKTARTPTPVEPTKTTSSEG